MLHNLNTMCLGIPGEVLETYERNGLKMARVRFGGVTREVSLAFTPEAQPGDYVIVHVGFALQVLNPQEAEEVLNLFQELQDAAEEAGP